MANGEDKLNRKWVGTRVGFVLAAIVCYFGTLFVITTFGTVVTEPATLLAVLETATIDDLVAVLEANEPQEVLDQQKTWEALEWLLMAIGAAIIGDTARPSGAKKASFGIAANGAGGQR